MKDSEHFPPQPGADVVFQSSDDVLFHLNPKHLEYGAEAFPPVGQNTAIPDPEHPIPLMEKSAILEPLFQFTSPKSQPDLEDFDFKTLMELAEAAEKYVVYSAIRTCVMKMKDFIPTYTQEIFQFGCKHGHEVLFFSIAPRFVNKPLIDMAYTMPLDLYIPWTLYYEQWMKMIDKLDTGLKMAGSHLLEWQSAIWWVRGTIISQPLELERFETLFQMSGSSCCTSRCCSRFVNWRNDMTVHILNMRDFKSFVKDHRARKVRLEQLGRLGVQVI